MVELITKEQECEVLAVEAEGQRMVSIACKQRSSQLANIRVYSRSRRVDRVKGVKRGAPQEEHACEDHIDAFSR